MSPNNHCKRIHKNVELLDIKKMLFYLTVELVGSFHTNRAKSIINIIARYRDKT